MRGKKAKILRKIAAKVDPSASGYVRRKDGTIVCTGYHKAVKEVKKAYKRRHGVL